MDLVFVGVLEARPWIPMAMGSYASVTWHTMVHNLLNSG